ncbi:hypothetical protein RSOLAG1IB_07196 [Rhizoctonia solani AG-1 IB]|uniref:Uncharacterized protein n=2 Tax=Rhizoctonia solani TaxID=456999 RepID=A0A8H2WA40_9AGAM|nr:unnamed protein product [Rhizoctonia solani]CEL54592.1 hypothetical protein RSOLAG1IB_07196 [Rhizoctonia solani AG-1 IB]
MAAVLPAAPVVPSQPSQPSARRMPRRLTISIMNNPPNFSSLAPLSSPSSSSSSGSDDESSMPPPGLGGRRLGATRTSTPTPKVNPYAAGGALCEKPEIAEPTVTPAPTARPRLLPQSTSFFVQSPAPSPARTMSSPKKVNPYAAGGALSETAPTPTATPKPRSLEKPMSRPLNLRVLTARQIQDMAQAAQAAHNNQVQARMVAESILNRVRRRSQRRRFPRFGGVVGFGQPSSSPLRKLAFDESDVSDDSGSSDGGSAHGDWSSEDGSDCESLEEWERQLGDVSWFVDNGYD